jgi:RNA polymerase sigma-70 factor (ECF subfamily)
MEILHEKPRFSTDPERKTFDKYFQPMMSLCLRYATNDSQAADLLSETFIRLFKQQKELNRQQDPDTWVKDFFVKQIVAKLKEDKANWLRVGTVRSTERKADDTNLSISKVADPELISALQHLPSAFRVTYNMYVMEGYSISQISEILETSALTVESNLSKARFELKQNLLKH